MNSKTTDSNNSNSAASTNENLIDNLQLIVADAEERLRATANHAGEKDVAAGARIQKNLQVVKDSMVAVETAMIEHSRKAAKATGPYVRDNVWNWY